MMETVFYGVTFAFGLFVGTIATTAVAILAIKRGGNR